MENKKNTDLTIEELLNQIDALKNKATQEEKRNNEISKKAFDNIVNNNIQEKVSSEVKLNFNSNNEKKTEQQNIFDTQINPESQVDTSTEEFIFSDNYLEETEKLNEDTFSQQLNNKESIQNINELNIDSTEINEILEHEEKEELNKNKKKKKGFRNFILIYIFIWILLILFVSFKVYGMAQSYQINYNIAEKNSSPDTYINKFIYDLENEIKNNVSTSSYDIHFSSEFETKEQEMSTIIQLYADKDLQYQRVENFKETHPQYNIYANRHCIGQIQLKSIGVDSYGFNIWAIESSKFETNDYQMTSLTIKVPLGAEVKLNDIVADKKYISKSIYLNNNLQTENETYDFSKVGKEYGYDIYKFDSLLSMPVITVSKDNITLTESNTEDNIITYFNTVSNKDLENNIIPVVNDFLNTYMDYMYRQITLDKINQYAATNSPAKLAFKNVANDLSWSGTIQSKEILESKYSDFVQYNDNVFAISTHIKLQIKQWRTYEEEFNSSWLFVKENGQWKVYSFAML